jgi:threonine/homoserine/homoserine lactone efflux protein
MGVLYRGLVLGVMVAAPVGPVGLLCIRRTLQYGLLRGFATGFGAAFADGLFSAVAAFGVAAILSLIQAYDATIHVVGGLFLLLVAWHTWHDVLRPPREETGSGKKLGALGAAVKALTGSFFITLTNPATLFGTLAVIATFGALRDRTEAATIVAGVFLGSSLWWLTLSGGTALIRRRFTEKGVLWLNRVTGLALTPLALWALAHGVFAYLGIDMPFERF